jgi:glycosyltransferase involved in cell wall biosynthesis
MKLAALCCTFRRPHTLGQLVESFLRQDYPAELRELVILDDAGQYENQTGEGWRLVSIPARFRSLGEKRNACAALASPDVDGFLVADDDDIYLPRWFRATADALSQADALQKTLRKRIDAGLDWLSIKSLPASRNAIPWFWNWADRRHAAWWDSEGLPFVQGPNMLFMNSATPRIDAEECALLDASKARLRG